MINDINAFSEKGSLTKLSNLKTVAHEMGHNIGLQHDCINYNCAHWHPSYVGPRVIDGVECYGYMDYKDDTNLWSRCSVEDFTKTKKSCLKICNGRDCQATSTGGKFLFLK